ncbi:MAG: RNA polymerase sigma-70 factor [Gemmatimonadota bacterium]|jgi:RNA polymerase sigma-70 factor (ECF subfamily)
MPEDGPNSRDGPPACDAEILARLRAGDASSLRELLKRHLPALRRYAERILGGSGDPEDAVQEAFVRLWTHRERWNGGASVRSLLFTITRNAALDELRRRRREVALQDESLFSPGPETPLPLRRLQEEELREAADEAIAGLPPRRREIFLLVREGGLTYREVAEVLGLSPQTVANLMSLALRNLRASLGPVLGMEPAARAKGPSRFVSGSE